MQEFSLLHPLSSEYAENRLTEEAINDLSIDFLLDNLTESRNERGHLRSLMTRVTDDPAVIRYRSRTRRSLKGISPRRSKSSTYSPTA